MCMAAVARRGMSVPSMAQHDMPSQCIQRCSTFCDSDLALLENGGGFVPGAGAAHDDVEVHTVDASVRVVLEAKIDVLGDTETPVA